MNPATGLDDSIDVSSNEDDKEFAKSISVLERMLTESLGAVDTKNVFSAPRNQRRVSFASGIDDVNIAFIQADGLLNLKPSPHRPCANVAGRSRKTDTLEKVSSAVGRVHHQQREIHVLTNALAEMPIGGNTAILQQAYTTLQERKNERDAILVVLQDEEEAAVSRGMYWKTKRTEQAAQSETWIKRWLEPNPYTGRDNLFCRSYVREKRKAINAIPYAKNEIVPEPNPDDGSDI